MAEFTLPHHHSDVSDALSIKETLDKTGNFTKVAEIFKNLGDSNRLRIFCLLCHREECVIDIAAMVDMTTPAVSHHLKVLKDYGIIKPRKVGTQIFYTLSLDKNLEEVAELVRSIQKLMAKIYPDKNILGDSKEQEPA